MIGFPTRIVRRWAIGLAAAALVLPAAAVADPRATLTAAAFMTRDKAAALQQVTAAEAEAKAQLDRTPNDREASLYRAMAIGYRAKLTRSAADAKTCRRMFELLASSDPRDPQAQAMVGGWHLDAIDDLGSMMAGMALGAKRAAGVAGIDRAAALGRNQATFPAIAALMHIRLDPANVAGATAYAEAATRAGTPTALDRIMQKQATALLVPLRAGDGKAAQKLARQLLPFGRLAG